MPSTRSSNRNLNTSLVHGHRSAQTHNNNTYIHVAIDYGTSNLAFGAGINTEHHRLAKIYSIGIQGNGQTVPQLLAYTPEGELKFGRDVEDLKLPQEDVIRNLKLYLHEEHRNSESGKVVRRKLERLEKHDHEVIAEHLLQVLLSVKPKLRKMASSRIHSPQFIAGLDVKVTLLVPACWTESGKETMANAGALAREKIAQMIKDEMVSADDTLRVTGIQVVAESTVGITSTNLEDFSGITVEEPFNMIVADGGGGTLDCVSYIVSPDVDSGKAVFEMTPECESRSLLAGSEIVSDKFFAWVSDECPEIQDMGGLGSFLHYFNITEMTFRNEVLEKFARIKHNFKAGNQRADRIRIDFEEHAQRCFDIEVPAQVVKEQFDPVIQDWISTIRSMCKHSNTKNVLLAGGFAQNEYLQSCLDNQLPDIEFLRPADRYENEKVKLVRGTLELYPEVEAVPFKQGYSWGIGIHETFNWERHPHCRLPQKGSRKGAQRRLIDKNSFYVRQEKDINGRPLLDEHGRAEWTVEHCIHPLLNKSHTDDLNTMKGEGSTVVAYNIDCDDLIIEVDVIRTSRRLEGGEPLWDTSGQVRPGLTLSAQLAKFELPPLDIHEYVPKVGTRGELCYTNVNINLALKVLPSQAVLTAQLYPHSYDGSRIKKRKRVEVLWEQSRVVWDQHTSTVLREDQSKPSSSLREGADQVSNDRRAETTVDLPFTVPRTRNITGPYYSPSKFTTMQQHHQQARELSSSQTARATPGSGSGSDDHFSLLQDAPPIQRDSQPGGGFRRVVSSASTPRIATAFSKIPRPIGRASLGSISNSACVNKGFRRDGGPSGYSSRSAMKT